ncbi:uncharacterized protein SPPG_01566 [Spizellomyces punctatus DAOM BR117]|uniref:Uncharacterized protein n=1 Tax=Spizellomyces punctatus (strain DAOM BR117) TaxID=645134 RepID=A0A0L0HSQ0_SPIPD|nr:uncharacterized protein SPPG_01566 [Spizellomyces punctatus DAOM BR117]KND04128.1 hypothetical protein SPPG_01566 [Spizellomyces punctatus DAOM BR117]|eukprot:XP_016612167.1 hypothetical protein SPPG_01566 [Spizellomyces punctatus DAOM BR117]
MVVPMPESERGTYHTSPLDFSREAYRTRHAPSAIIFGDGSTRWSHDVTVPEPLDEEPEPVFYSQWARAGARLDSGFDYVPVNPFDDMFGSSAESSSEEDEDEEEEEERVGVSEVGQTTMREEEEGQADDEDTDEELDDESETDEDEETEDDEEDDDDDDDNDIEEGNDQANNFSYQYNLFCASCEDQFLISLRQPFSGQLQCVFCGRPATTLPATDDEESPNLNTPTDSDVRRQQNEQVEVTPNIPRQTREDDFIALTDPSSESNPSRSSSPIPSAPPPPPPPPPLRQETQTSPRTTSYHPTPPAQRILNAYLEEFGPNLPDLDRLVALCPSLVVDGTTSNGAASSSSSSSSSSSPSYRDRVISQADFASLAPLNYEAGWLRKRKRDMDDDGVGR